MKLNNGEEILDRIYYYVLDWRDRYEKKDGIALRDKTKAEVLDFFTSALCEDLKANDVGHDFW